MYNFSICLHLISCSDWLKLSGVTCNAFRGEVMIKEALL